MREIKFRYTCKRDNGHTFCEIFTLEQIEAGDAKRWMDVNLVGQFHLFKSQYTGKKDRDGKEIYEGDIVTRRNRSDLHSLVYYDDRDFSYRLAVNGDREFDKTYSLMFAGVTIGNIYENSELLKGGN